jgi:hypothetical protein
MLNFDEMEGFSQLRLLFPEPKHAFTSLPKVPSNDALITTPDSDKGASSPEQTEDEGWYTDDDDAEAHKKLAQRRGQQVDPTSSYLVYAEACEWHSKNLAWML